MNHAEINAIMNKTESTLDKCTIFVTQFPCIECAKMIAQSGIKNIVYIEESICQQLSEEEANTAKCLLKLSGVSLLKLK